MSRREKRERRDKEDRRDSSTTALVIGGVVVVVGGLIVAAVVLGGGDANAATPPTKSPPTPTPTPPMPGPGPVEPTPTPPVDVDTGDNWGATPAGLRQEFERAEEASGIPALARFMAVWAWGAFRAKKPFVTPAEAAAISAANPQWCSNCHNDSVDERKKSKEALDNALANNNPPWPKPTDYDGWGDGSSGLFDLLRGAQVFAGIHNDNRFLPLITLPASVIFRTDVQLYIAGYIVYRIVFREDLKVIVPGDSAATWSNIRACTANPQGFKDLVAGKNTAAAKVAAEAKANCLGRAQELGIDLSKLPPPLPWKWPGAKAYWTRLGVMNPPAKQVKEPVNTTQQVGSFTVRRIPATRPGSPVVWLLHGLGGGVEQLEPLASELALEGTVDAEYILLSRGSSWIDNPDGSPDQVAQQLQKVAGELVAQRGALNGNALRPWLVLGYSQGGAVAYQIAAANLPTIVIAAAARLPKPPPLALKPTTRIVAVQGNDDKTVTPKESEAAAAMFSKAGYNVVWDLQAGAGHSLSTLGAPIVEVLRDELAKLPAAKDAFPAGTKSVLLPAGLFARVVEPPGLKAGAPLVVVLHGEGTNEGQLLALRQAELAGLTRMAFLRTSRGDGRWLPASDPNVTFDDALLAAGAKVQAAVNKLKAEFFAKQVVVVGYSEGASVALLLGAQGVVDVALSIAGYLPSGLAPIAAVPTWVSLVFGGADQVIPPATSQGIAGLFVGKASRVTQQEVAAATHGLPTLLGPATTALDEILTEVA